MKLIKCASMYRVNLPGAAALRQHLQELPFTELAPSALSGAGFVPVPATKDIVSSFEGGLAFALRYDEKILPASVVASETQKRIAQMELDQYRRIGKKESRQIKEMVANELCCKALTRTAVLVSFYHVATQTLVIPSTSQRMTDLVTSLLVRACGSITSHTINVSNVKGGLTTRLKAYITERNDAFGTFNLGDEIWMAGEDGRVTVSGSVINSATETLTEALGHGKQVTAVQLRHGDTTFRLTDSFKLKGIQFGYTPDNGVAVDAVEAWQHEAAVQLLLISNVVNDLCELFEYKDQPLKKAA